MNCSRRRIAHLDASSSCFDTASLSRKKLQVPQTGWDAHKQSARSGGTKTHGIGAAQAAGSPCYCLPAPAKTQIVPTATHVVGSTGDEEIGRIQLIRPSGCLPRLPAIRIAIARRVIGAWWPVAIIARAPIMPPIPMAAIVMAIRAVPAMLAIIAIGMARRHVATAPIAIIAMVAIAIGLGLGDGRRDADADGGEGMARAAKSPIILLRIHTSPGAFGALYQR